MICELHVVSLKFQRSEKKPWTDTLGRKKTGRQWVMTGMEAKEETGLL